MSKTDVVIVGAGPYGLSLAAHLGARGIEHRIFGQPMKFWSGIVKGGSKRYLKSFCFATNLSTPKRGFNLVDYNSARGLEEFEPCSMSNFTDYGSWFQRHNVSWSESADIIDIVRRDGGFVVTTASGETIRTGNVIIATGLSNFAKTPSVFAQLPNDRVSHTSEITSFNDFNGRNVAVIGAGQSALEAAALLYEAGAFPQLIVRENTILWHSRVQRDRRLLDRMRKPMSALGLGPKAWALVNLPGLLNRLPDGLRMRLTKDYLPPEGAWWLRERVEGRAAVHLGASVIAATASDKQITLRVSGADGSNRELNVDHVIAGSGYDIDIQRLPFLDIELRKNVRCNLRAPKLDRSFSSSVPGLFFVGPLSNMSFGPLFRFVAGADFTARTVSKRLSRLSSANELSECPTS